MCEDCGNWLATRYIPDLEVKGLSDTVNVVVANVQFHQRVESL